jgi:hypothetical protein
MKGFENDRIVPIASARLRSAGTCERVAHDPSRTRDTKLYPILREGVMMSGQNFKAYAEAKQDEWRRSWLYRAQQRLADMRRKKTVTPVTNIEEWR